VYLVWLRLAKYGCFLIQRGVLLQQCLEGHIIQTGELDMYEINEKTILKATRQDSELADYADAVFRSIAASFAFDKFPGLAIYKDAWFKENLEHFLEEKKGSVSGTNAQKGLAVVKSMLLATNDTEITFQGKTYKTKAALNLIRRIEKGIEEHENSSVAEMPSLGFGK